MNRDSTPLHPHGSQVQLIGILLVGLSAWGFATQESLSQEGPAVPHIHTAAGQSPRVVNWAYFISSLLLLATGLYAGWFDFINNRKQGCHPKSNLLFIALVIPGLASAFTILNDTSGFFMLAMSMQLIVVACIYCIVGYTSAGGRPMSPIRRFMQLDLGLQIFLIYSIVITSFALFPTAWSTIVPARFWEARVVGLNGVLALGSAMAALLGYQILDCLPPNAGAIHVLCYLLCTVGAILPVNFYKTLVLTIPVVLQIIGIFWDILVLHQLQATELLDAQEDRKYWQSVAEQMQSLNNVHEAAITTKSCFLTGLASEMKSIVHGTSMVMSMLNDTDLQPNQITYLARLDRAVDRLTNLVREAQYYFDVESLKSNTDSVPFRLDQLLEEVINSTSIRTHLEERDVDVTYIVDSSVPMCLLGDYSRLKNILLRLLTNAIKATVQGEIVIRVRSPNASAPSTPSNNAPSFGSFNSELAAMTLSPPSTPTRSSFYTQSGTGSPRNLRSPRAPFLNVNTNQDPESYNNYSNSPRVLSSVTPKNSSASLQRSSSQNSMNSARTTPRSATGTRPTPDFEGERSHSMERTHSMERAHSMERGHSMLGHLSPPTSPLSVSSLSSPNLVTHGIVKEEAKELLGEDTVLLSISVVDTGIGIPPEDLGRIFEPFAMVNRKREDTDLGLGLSICKQLARLFGGNLTVQSELSRGTSFTLTCPFRVNANTHMQNINSMFGTGSMLQRTWGTGKTICIIDNNASIGAVCKMHLVPVGCEVLYYATTSEAIAQMKVFFELGRVCDAVLVGYRLYGTNGEETARLLRSDPDLQHIPVVIMCTAKQRKQITLPNVHYLYKPLKKEQLLTIAHMLCTVQPHQPAPPSPEAFRDFPESRSPRASLLSESSPAIPRPNSMKFPPLSLPSLPPLPEQEELSPPQPRKTTSPVAGGLDRPVERHEHRSHVIDSTSPQTTLSSTSASSTSTLAPLPSSSSSSSSSSSLSASMVTSPSSSAKTSPLSLSSSLSASSFLSPSSSASSSSISASIPSLSPTEHSKHNHVLDDQHLQQEQQLQQLQQTTDKMLDLQQPLATPIKVTSLSASAPRDGSPRAVRVGPSISTPSLTSNSTSSTSLLPSMSGSRTPRTASPDNPIMSTPHRRGSISNEAAPHSPLSQSQVQPAQTPQENSANGVQDSVPPVIQKKETILLVEDNPINAKIASAVLRRHQFEVELAGNGQVALEKIKLTHGNFQLILMDIHMPVMDGLTCARLTRQFEKEHNLVGIPIIALTADATTMHRTACLEAGCNEFMSKPLDYPLLIEILKKLSAGGSLLTQP